MARRSRAEEMVQTRLKILDAGKTLFMKKGYRAVTTREIALAAKITQPAMYHHFQDKEVLYLEVVKNLTADIQSDMKNILDKKINCEAKLNLVVLNLIEKHPTNILLMVHDILNELKKENQKVLYDLWYRSYFLPIETIFADFVKNGDIESQLTSKEATEYFLSAITPLFMPVNLLSTKEIREKVSKRIYLILFGFMKKEV
ncbi:TetR/AcrR family transcriptional regulator [Listeria aquatica]|uniref:TetR/AcrR family transcriptional regulator n=1 Tax=Listeria aquatica TaxID=1494960 RepID=UPI003EF84DEE